MTTTPKARAQEAINWINNGMPTLLDDDEIQIIQTLRGSLALSAALERVPEGWFAKLQNNLVMKLWSFTAYDLQDRSQQNQMYGTGQNPTAAILAALEALEKHAAAVKRGEI